MKKIPNLFCEAQVKLGQSADEASNPSGKIEAVATTWGAREGADGRKFNYQPEGFMQWADEFSKAGKPMPMFLNHNDMGMPIGEWNEIAMDEQGMTAKGRLYLSTVGGSDVYSVLKESPNMFGGVSVGAYADEAMMVDEQGNPLVSGQDEDEGFFQIKKGGLREISVVMYPNNPAAEVMKLEYFDTEGHANPRVIEKALRDAGLSRKDATTASSVLKKVLEMRDAKPVITEVAPQQGELEAVVNEADAILKALKERELLKALSKRIK
ncbi:Prohead protease [uncultured Caudovirales phage]|uniref:Prohead protease n=1 Tax=uncultured Caudovirales phage TaxID=2100421 RepID=A0A6J5KIQ8_9CAUD|nr:Prohead protease [uncultured Caudovirales phage]